MEGTRRAPRRNLGGRDAAALALGGAHGRRVVQDGGGPHAVQRHQRGAAQQGTHRSASDVAVLVGETALVAFAAASVAVGVLAALGSDGTDAAEVVARVAGGAGLVGAFGVR